MEDIDISRRSLGGLEIADLRPAGLMREADGSRLWRLDRHGLVLMKMPDDIQDYWKVAALTVTGSIDADGIARLREEITWNSVIVGGHYAAFAANGQDEEARMAIAALARDARPRAAAVKRGTFEQLQERMKSLSILSRLGIVMGTAAARKRASASLALNDRQGRSTADQFKWVADAALAIIRHHAPTGDAPSSASNVDMRKPLSFKFKEGSGLPPLSGHQYLPAMAEIEEAFEEVAFIDANRAHKKGAWLAGLERRAKG